MVCVPPSRVLVSSAEQKLLERLLSRLWPAPTLLEVSTALPLPPGSLPDHFAYTAQLTLRSLPFPV